jgi:hypothetical protein
MYDLDFKNFIIDMIKVDTNPTVGWKVNNLCCLLGALTSTLIAITCSKILVFSKLSKNINDFNKESKYYNIFSSSSIAGYLYAFSPLVWEYGATSAEVFALNNFLCSLLVYLTSHIYILTHQYKQLETERSRGIDYMNTSRHIYLLIGAFISGCCLSNQHASFFHLLVLIPFVLYITADISFKLSFFPLIIMSALLGLSPYTYLHISSLSPTPGTYIQLSTYLSI